MKTQKTSDYSLFTYDEKNREVRPSQMRKIQKDMAKRGFIEAFPIIVTKERGGKLRICDGQHRFESAKSLGIPVVYFISDYEIDPATVPASQAWSTNDFIHRYASQGIEAYVKIVDAAKKNGVSLATASSILTDDLCKNKSAAMREGRLELVDPVQGFKVLATADVICKINKSLLINPLARALYRLTKLESINFKALSERLIHNADLIKRFNNMEIGVMELDQAYNYKLPYNKRIPIEHEINRIMAERKATFGKAGK